MSYTITDLIEIIKTLRSPDGCPWDRNQSTQTMGPHLLEEVYEVLSAIETQDNPALSEELGDLLFVVLLTCHIAESENRLTLSELFKSINEKMIRRHPHVFGGETLRLDEISKKWAEIKAKEKPKNSRLDGIPNNLPALQSASRLGQKASSVGFDWPNYKPVLSQVYNELDELKEAINDGEAEAITHEVGDVLLSMASLSRHLKNDPETALRKANRRFTDRFHDMETQATEAKIKLSDCQPSELELLWAQAKTNLQSQRK